jgi:hypothetical protein
MRTATALAAVLLITPGPSLAQTAGDDWDFGEDASRKLSVAAVSFENFGVAVRCIDGSLSVVLSGLPVASGQRRLLYSMGGAPETESLWVSGDASNAAFAVWPRSVATAMSRGGRLSVAATDGEATRRYAVDLPPSTSSVGRVFQACGHDLDPARPDESPGKEDFAGLVWAKRPEVSYPGRARHAAGMAAILCYARGNGGLRNCTVESEFPEGSGFGRAATLGAHQTARVETADGSDADIEGRRIAFVVRYRMADIGLAPPPSRLPDRDEIYNPPPPETR